MSKTKPIQKIACLQKSTRFLPESTAVQTGQHTSPSKVRNSFHDRPYKEWRDGSEKGLTFSARWENFSSKSDTTRRKHWQNFTTSISPPTSKNQRCRLNAKQTIVNSAEVNNIKSSIAGNSFYSWKTVLKHLTTQYSKGKKQALLDNKSLSSHITDHSFGQNALLIYLC